MTLQERKLVTFIGLAQAGAVCAAAAACRISMRFGGQTLRGATLIADCGLLLLLVPLVWALYALRMMRRDETDGFRWLAVIAAGVLWAGVTLVYAVWAIVRPMIVVGAF
jgi:hypothetical protein